MEKDLHMKINTKYKYKIIQAKVAFNKKEIVLLQKALTSISGRIC